MISPSGRVDRIDLVGVESEPLLDHAHLIVRRLVCPDRVLRAVLHGVVRGRALEWAYGLMLRADEPVHLHVLARDVINGWIVALLEPDRVPGVGDDLAVELHPDAHARRVRRDAMVRMLLVSGAAVGFHGILLSDVSRSAVDHPRRAEAVDQHTEGFDPESLLQGHGHLAAFG